MKSQAECPAFPFYLCILYIFYMPFCNQMNALSKIKISAVSFLNTLPFIYGIRKSGLMNQIELSLDTPIECADKLYKNEADAGLIPIASIPEMKESFVISDYCISAKGIVSSVVLLSEVPMEKIKFILTDYRSRTSVQLLKILLHNYWNNSPVLLQTKAGYETEIKNETAGLVIGDNALLLKKNFPFVYDLSEAWFEMTSLPFVFACWVSNKKLPENFIEQFNASLRFGINHIDEAVAEQEDKTFPADELMSYLKNNISYLLDDDKKKGMKLFFEFLKKEELSSLKDFA